MMHYNYYDVMREDVREAIRDYNFADYATLEKLEERLNEDLWIDDSVTGNGSGSYTFDRWTARDYVLDNTDLMRAAAEEFGDIERVKNWIYNDEWELVDVTIRCYLLATTIVEALEDIREEFEAAHENDEEEEE